LTGNCITLDVKLTDTVLDLKTKIKDKEGITSDRLRLTFAGKTLYDDRTLNDYNIQKECTIRMR